MLPTRLIARGPDPHPHFCSPCRLPSLSPCCSPPTPPPPPRAGTAGPQPAGDQVADLRGPPCSVEDEAPLPAQSCAAADRGGGRGAARALARGSEGVSLGLMQHPGRVGSSAQPEAQARGGRGGAPGQSPPEHLFRGPVHELWELQEEDSPTSGAKAGGPPQGRPRRTQEPQRAPPPWERVPPCGQECEQQGQRGDPCCSRPPWGPQSPGSRQDRQPQVQAETVPSTGVGGGGRSLAPRAPS